MTTPNKAQHTDDRISSAAHKEWCASLRDSKASKVLGQCYCDCGVEESKSQWRLWEEIDGTCTVFPVGTDPDDLAFARVKPLCTIPAGTPFEIARLIAAAPELLEACKAAMDYEAIHLNGGVGYCIAIKTAAHNAIVAAIAKAEKRDA